MLINKILKHRNLIFRHLVVSFACAATELSSFALFWKLLPTLIYLDYTFAFMMATSVGFVLHARFTFATNDRIKKRALLFLGQACLVFVIGLTIFRIIILFIPHPLIAKPVQLVITFALNIAIGKTITFKRY
jgi:putative flippase GtrA